ncbi:myo-inosose-2 dehydratase [Kitasatospora azatica]|uniref:myo-inosose-2 dehydratase n=1 Tax=Kitasatospora azatica TaxID=58347 RepID=UPI000565DE65|nr:myo-inosose-2 dehydratase [Kitasatospora azatica]
MFTRDQVLLGITPTGWTNDDLPSLGAEIPYEQILSEIALAGFDGCSIGHSFPRDPAVLGAALELRGLRISEPWVSTYFTVREMREATVAEFRRQLELLRSLGGTDLVVAELGGSVHQQPVDLRANRPVLDDRGWKELVDGLHELGEIASGNGMRLCYHHHMGTVVQSPAEVDRLMAATDPELVHLLLDTGHFSWAGGDPAAAVRAHGPRIAHVHLKDLRPQVLAAADRSSFLQAVLDGVFTVPGDGMVDFPEVLAELAQAGYRGWLTVEAEQDPAKAHPLTYALKARAYLREVIGV